LLNAITSVDTIQKDVKKYGKVGALKRPTTKRAIKSLAIANGMMSATYPLLSALGKAIASALGDKDEEELEEGKMTRDVAAGVVGTTLSGIPYIGGLLGYLTDNVIKGESFRFSAAPSMQFGQELIDVYKMIGETVVEDKDWTPAETRKTVKIANQLATFTGKNPQLYAIYNNIYKLQHQSPSEMLFGTPLERNVNKSTGGSKGTGSKSKRTNSRRGGSGRRRSSRGRR